MTPGVYLAHGFSSALKKIFVLVLAMCALTKNCFHLGGMAFYSRSLPTQRGNAELNKTPAGKRHTNKANQLQTSRHPHRSFFQSRTRPRPANTSGAQRAHPHLSSNLSHELFPPRGNGLLLPLSPTHTKR
jgi:hypothetical protein